MKFDALSYQFLFSLAVTLKFSLSTFERSLIFKFEMSAILNNFTIQNFNSHPFKRVFLTRFFQFRTTELEKQLTDHYQN